MLRRLKLWFLGAAFLLLPTSASAQQVFPLNGIGPERLHSVGSSQPGAEATTNCHHHYTSDLNISLSFQNAASTHQLIGETWVSSSEVTAWALAVQLPVGIYDRVLENPDGQSATLPAAVTVP
jgi:hypothetical protein